MTLSAGPEFRTDVLTGLRVLVAPARSSRPSAIHPEPPLSRSDDPFVEGNESETPGERFAVRDPSSSANGPGWQLRVVPNRYPAVISNSASPADAASLVGLPSASLHDSTSANFFPALPAFGEHDVVIECPDSRSRLTELSIEEVQTVLVAWRSRVRQLADAKRFASVAVFRNEGFSAGASLSHCHSQIVATEQLMPLDDERGRRASLHFQKTGRELVADLLAAELADGRRVIRKSHHFVMLCPFASRTSWHIRFVPVSSLFFSFADTTEECLCELASLLKEMLTRLEQVLGTSFSFNLTLPQPRLDQPPQFRWTLDLLPRTGRHAGWEYLTSVDIVTVAPEDAARMLRS